MKKLIVSFLVVLSGLGALSVGGSSGCNNNATPSGVTPGTGTPAFTVGGAVTGLSGTVVLQNNGADDLSVTQDTFIFATELSDKAAYDVTVLTQPAGQTCTVSNGSGTIDGANVVTVQVSCTTTAPAAICGNGSIEAGEDCDDGNTVTEECTYGLPSCTVCSAACKNVAGVPHTCGDGTKDPQEGCDLGAANNNDTGPCLTTCVSATCGDGKVHAGVEQCDLGTGVNNDTTPDTCRTNCTDPRCGDGVMDAGEQCDDGNQIDHDACTNDCKLPTCADGIANQDETDVDCGGAACAPRCADALKCKVSNDCASGVCSGGVCVVAVCNDLVKNGTETDLDCGGSNCPACATGKICGANADCSSGHCNSGLCVECNAPSDCPGTDNECQQRTCNSNGCGFSFTAANTPVIIQTSNECQQTVCDGAGGTTDVPKPDGIACDDGDACTLSDSCQSGVCVGVTPVICTPSDECHVSGSCDSTTGMCSNPVANAGTTCSSGVCDGFGVCQTLASGSACTNDAQCASGVCDSSTNLCN